MNRKIALLCPTSNRPDDIECLIRSIERTADDLNNFVLYLGIDSDDHESSALVDAHARFKTYVKKITFPVADTFPGLGKLWNIMAENTTEDVIAMVGDDFEFMTPNWDVHVLKSIERVFQPAGLYLIHCADGIQRGKTAAEVLATNSFIPRKYIDMFGRYLQEWKHLYVDTWLNDVFQGAGLKYFLPWVLIKHNHVSVTGDVDCTTRRLREHCEWQSATMLYQYTEPQRLEEIEVMRNETHERSDQIINNMGSVNITKNRTVDAHVLVRDEQDLLPVVHDNWKNIPVDRWLFFNDNSRDSTVDVIRDLFGSQAKIINENPISDTHESISRGAMFNFSKHTDASHVLSIDCDELVTQTMIDDFDKLLNVTIDHTLSLYQYNVTGVNGHYRTDPSYKYNFRNFLLFLDNYQIEPVPKSQDIRRLPTYHTPRTPKVNLNKPCIRTKKYGFMHLQSINKKYYALKQLWYKHFELKHNNLTVNEINERYDPVVNGLDFQPEAIPSELCPGVNFEAIDRAYVNSGKLKTFQSDMWTNKTQQLITFGEQYL